MWKVKPQKFLSPSIPPTQCKTLENPYYFPNPEINSFRFYPGYTQTVSRILMEFPETLPGCICHYNVANNVIRNIVHVLRRVSRDFLFPENFGIFKGWLPPLPGLANN